MKYFQSQFFETRMKMQEKWRVEDLILLSTQLQGLLKAMWRKSSLTDYFLLSQVPELNMSKAKREIWLLEVTTNLLPNVLL